MKNKKTYYQLILDRSGSMQDCINETISGFNEQIQMIQNFQNKFPEQEFFVSLGIFNNLIEHPVKMKKPNDVNVLTRENFVPNGGTALLDAIGESVFSLKGQIQCEIENDEATAVVVILTDGYENASRHFNWEAIRRLILDLEATKSWTFSFLGSTLDAIDIASRMNIKKQNAVYFSKVNIKDTLTNMSESFVDYAAKKQRLEKPDSFLKK